MKAKPLIILIPCILVLGILFWIDNPQRAAQTDAAQMAQSTQADRTDPEAGGSAMEGKDGADASAPLTLHLVVGQNGSLEDDITCPVYARPDESSEKLGSLQYNCCILCSGNGDGTVEGAEDWIAVRLSQGVEPGEDELTGYLKRENLMLKTLTVNDPDLIRMGIVRKAAGYLGLKFVRYGDSLKKGIDCSHFVEKIYRKNGEDIPESCNDMAAVGETVALEDARAGDVIYYDVNDGYGHVGIYLGDGYLINSTGHAGREYPDGGVRICALKYHDREQPAAYDLLD